MEEIRPLKLLKKQKNEEKQKKFMKTESIELSAKPAPSQLLEEEKLPEKDGEARLRGEKRRKEFRKQRQKELEKRGKDEEKIRKEKEIEEELKEKHEEKEREHPKELEKKREEKKRFSVIGDLFKRKGKAVEHIKISQVKPQPELKKVEVKKDSINAIKDHIHKARLALMDFKFDEAKRIYIEITGMYLELDPKKKAKVYEDIKDLYYERKTADKFAK